MDVPVSEEVDVRVFVEVAERVAECDTEKVDVSVEVPVLEIVFVGVIVFVPVRV